VALGAAADRQQQRLAKATAVLLDEHMKWLGKTCLASGT
jgi:hypothetical protein